MRYSASLMSEMGLVSRVSPVQTALHQRDVDFDQNGSKAKKIRRTLDYLLKAFPNPTPELERYSVLSLYVLTSHLLERYVVQDVPYQVAEWFINFEAYRRAQRELPGEQCDSEIVAYQEKTSHSTDSGDSIQWRHELFLRKFLETYPALQLKDDQRSFTRDQRTAIFRRDKGLCQVRIKCHGAQCSWESWEADHKYPWSKGGKTTVENGQVACLSCNSAKGADVKVAA